METRNINQILRIVGSYQESKVSRLLDFTEVSGNIDDPWYTGDFESTYQLIQKGCMALLERIKKEIA